MLELIAKTESVEPAHQESKLASVPDRVTVSQFQIFSETWDTSRRPNTSFRRLQIRLRTPKPFVDRSRISMMAEAISPRKLKQKREQDYVAALTKVTDLTTLLTNVDAGAYDDLASNVGSVATTDFRTAHDDRLSEGKLLTKNSRIMCKWFQLLFDDVVAGNFPPGIEGKDAAYHHVDESRVEVFRKLWQMYDEVTKNLYPSNSKEDCFARKAIGNNLDITFNMYLLGRDKPISKYGIDDPDFNEPPPNRKDFHSFRPKTPSISDRVAGVASSVVGALSPRAAKVMAYNGLANGNNLPVTTQLSGLAASSPSTSRSTAVSTRSASKKTPSAAVMPPPPPVKNNAVRSKEKSNKANSKVPPLPTEKKEEKKLKSLPPKVENKVKMDNDKKAKRLDHVDQPQDKGNDDNADGAAAKKNDAAKETTPTRDDRAKENAQSSDERPVVPNEGGNDAATSDAAPATGAAAANDGAATTGPPNGVESASDPLNPISAANPTQEWIISQNNRLESERDNVFEVSDVDNDESDDEDEDEDDDDVIIEDVLNDGQQKVEQLKQLSSQYSSVEQQQRIDISAFKEQIASLERYKSEKEARKQQRREKRQQQKALEISNSHTKAQEEQNAVAQRVRKNRDEMQQYISKLAILQQQVQDMESSSEEESDDDDNDAQVTNGQGVFSSTKNDAAENTPPKSDKGAKKRRRRSTPKKKNASKFPPNDLGPLDSGINNKIKRVGVVHEPAPRKDAAPIRGAGTNDTPIVLPVAPSTEKHPANQPDFAQFIHAMELDQTRRNVEKVRPKDVFVKYNHRQNTNTTTI